MCCWSNARGRDLAARSGQGLRTATGGTWSTVHNASYGYDDKLDTLTSETIGGVTTNWSYDAAGNRNDALTDNLNRMTASPGFTYSNDVLGNRTLKDSGSANGDRFSYGWDVLNRMTSLHYELKQSSPLKYSDSTYTYRGDGMRVAKSTDDHTGGTPVTKSTVYRYDGQMPMQDVETAGTTTTTTNYALGGRGIDAVSKTEGGTTSVGYPIYDAHGNRAATLVKSGASFSLTDVRTYDAWGNVRVGSLTGRPRARYCANLGHVQDDESGLVYMRARYYEPSSGRFVSEDPSMDGDNWFAYCRNCPGNYVDPQGKVATVLLGALAGAAGAVGAILGAEFGNWLFHHDYAIMLTCYHNMIDRMKVLEKIQENFLVKGLVGIIGGSIGGALGVALPGAGTSVGLAFAIGFFLGAAMAYYSQMIESLVLSVADEVSG